MVAFNDKATEVVNNASKTIKRRESLKRQESILDKNKTFNNIFDPKDKEIYVVASFNDWMPMRMKTLRTLNLERYPMDQGANEVEIPRAVFLLDDTIALYASMVPPGTHYFYFVRSKGRIFLTPHHPVVRFKNTKIFMNKIEVTKRLEDIQTVHQAKDGEDDEAVFMKDRSVFRDYREDT